MFILFPCRIKLEECIRKQELQLNSMREERDTLCRLSEEYKMEIRLKEDKMEGTNNELQDALRKTKEGKYRRRFIYLFILYIY